MVYRIPSYGRFEFPVYRNNAEIRQTIYTYKNRYCSDELDRIRPTVLEITSKFKKYKTTLLKQIITFSLSFALLKYLDWKPIILLCYYYTDC